MTHVTAPTKSRLHLRILDEMNRLLVFYSTTMLDNGDDIEWVHHNWNSSRFVHRYLDRLYQEENLDSVIRDLDAMVLNTARPDYARDAAQRMILVIDGVRRAYDAGIVK